MPEGWALSTVDTLGEINPEALSAGTPQGFTFRYIDLSAVERGRIDWSLVRGMMFREAPSRARRLVRGGDVLFGTVRPALQSHASIPADEFGPLVASTGFAVIRAAAESADSRFLYHSVLSHLFSLQARRTEVGSNYPAVNESDVRAFLVPHPDPTEQRRIAAILDTLVEAIRQTEQVIAKLQQMKQGLLHDLLTRGADEHGDLRPSPTEAPHLYKDSPLGRIPKAWKATRLGGISTFITSGSRGWAAFYADAGPLFLRIANLTRQHINLRFDSVVFVRPPATSESKRTAVRPGDLLISITADLGIIGVVPADLGEAYVNQHIALVRLDEARVSSRWIAQYLAGNAGRRQFRNLNDMGAKAGLNLPTVGNLLVAVPNHREQNALAEVIDSVDRSHRLERVLVEKLRAKKCGLLHDLLTGRVRVPLPAEASV